MPYLIDGHNLIPKVGLKLSSFDDEYELLNLLQEFCRLRRVQVEVYFDGAPPGQAGKRKAGVVTAHFIREGSSADAAIETRLVKIKNSAKNWTVISSDRRIQRSARASGANVMSADEFALKMRETYKTKLKNTEDEPVLSTNEVEEWLRTFKKKKD